MVAVAEDTASLAIPPAKKGDLSSIVDLAAQVHAESQWARFPLDRSRTRALLSSLMESPDGVVLIAIEGGGSKSCPPTSDTARDLFAGATATSAT